MDYTLIIQATLWIGGIGCVLAAALAIADTYLSVKEDPRIGQVVDCLPGANCGGCGFAGCGDYARAIVLRGAPFNACAPGGADTAEAIGRVLGKSADTSVKRVALIHCCGTTDEAITRARYNGIVDCTAAHATAGGDKACAYGCLGYASCANVCPVHAIHIENGVAKVNKTTCIGCGRCVAKCPRKLIELVPAAATIHILCSNPDKGPAVKKVCGTGCIGCRLCTKVTEPSSITVTGFLAKVNYTNPPTQTELVAKCPGKCIRLDEKGNCQS